VREGIHAIRVANSV